MSLKWYRCLIFLIRYCGIFLKKNSIFVLIAKYGSPRDNEALSLDYCHHTVQTLSTQSWDIGHIIEAVLAATRNLSASETGPTLMKGHDFIKKSQVF